MDFFVICCCCFFVICFEIIKVTTKNYQGYYWAAKIAKNGPKQHNKLPFFCPKGKQSLGQSLPQELEVGPRSGPCLLVQGKEITHKEQL